VGTVSHCVCLTVKHGCVTLNMTLTGFITTEREDLFQLFSIVKRTKCVCAYCVCVFLCFHFSFFLPKFRCFHFQTCSHSKHIIMSKSSPMVSIQKEYVQIHFISNTLLLFCLFVSVFPTLMHSPSNGIKTIKCGFIDHFPF
jgi:hypothetical protein